jgi:flagellar basal body rod protein FlgG
VQVSPTVSAALERIEARASDVYRAFTPGAQPVFDDVARTQTSYADANPLCIAPPANTYFLERAGDGQLRYTRDGDFVIRDGVLCSRDGRPVLGYATDRNLNEIRIDPVDLALGRASGMRISADGVVDYRRSVVDPRTGASEERPVVAGRVALARFPAGTRLPQAGDELAAPDGVQPEIGTPGTGDFGAVAAMRRQSSGIDIDASIDRLRLAYVDFDAVAAAYRARYDEAKSAMDVVK